MIKIIKGILDSNSVNCELIQPDGSSKEILKIPLEHQSDIETNQTSIEIMFVDGMEEATEGLSLLQFFIMINLEISSLESTRLNLLKFISKINHTLAVGSFYLYPEDKFIYFKYNMCVVKKDDSSMELKLTRAIWLIKTQLNNYFKEFISINQMIEK
jgi:hypothetical protein